MADYPVLKLKKGRDVSLRRGHPWIFSGAVSRVEGDPASGDVVTAASCDGDPVALGFYQPSDIVFRRLSWDTRETVDIDFWRRRLRDAMSLRRRVVPPDTTAYRLVNAEGDGMPGLVADLYDDVLAVSIGTSGMDRRREELVEVFRTELCPGRIYERSEGRSRRREGLSDRVGLLLGERLPALVPIREEGRKYLVDVASGQKTGFFLDQRTNRGTVAQISAGMSVLNAFSYTGGFSVACACAGAARVVSVEVSAAANVIAGRNLAANGISLERHPIVEADVFNYLRETKESFDLIILDPPAFAKSSRDVPSAARGYKEVHLQALKRLKRGGILATFSCSNPVDEELFRKIVLGALRDAGRSAGILRSLGPSPDHPTDPGHPEGRYLKGLLLFVS
ncbi:MAG: class I SAM-dependent rRNA methyltransferase [Syntrophales bacterium]|nr:class I SAM-dependent rRNA methyltransferase [Syntrophales bacterium]